VEPFPLPKNLALACAREHRGGWAAALPGLVDDLEGEWGLQVGEPFEPGGQTAWVAPAVSAAHGNCVVKLAWRHPESEDEAAGLRCWDGRGAVRLFADEVRGDTAALLLERCMPGTVLADRPAREQDEVIAQTLRSLWQAPVDGHPFRTLTQMCDEWAEQSERKYWARPVDLDPGLVGEGLALFRSLPATAERAVLLCTDLHAENVLAAEREPWLMIDPKPYVGDPTYDVVQHLLGPLAGWATRSSPSDMAAVIESTRRLADLLDLDDDRLVQWMFARCVQEAPEVPDLAAAARRFAPMAM
jgi:streptomycin 6-kinase